MSFSQYFLKTRSPASSYGIFENFGTVFALYEGHEVSIPTHTGGRFSWFTSHLQLFAL